MSIATIDYLRRHELSRGKVVLKALIFMMGDQMDIKNKMRTSQCLKIKLMVNLKQCGIFIFPMLFAIECQSATPCRQKYQGGIVFFNKINFLLNPEKFKNMLLKVCTYIYFQGI